MRLNCSGSWRPGSRSRSARRTRGNRHLQHLVVDRDLGSRLGPRKAVRRWPAPVDRFLSVDDLLAGVRLDLPDVQALQEVGEELRRTPPAPAASAPASAGRARACPSPPSRRPRWRWRGSSGAAPHLAGRLQGGVLQDRQRSMVDWLIGWRASVDGAPGHEEQGGHESQTASRRMGAVLLMGLVTASAERAAARPGRPGRRRGRAARAEHVGVQRLEILGSRPRTARRRPPGRRVSDPEVHVGRAGDEPLLGGVVRLGQDPRAFRSASTTVCAPPAPGAGSRPSA